MSSQGSWCEHRALNMKRPGIFRHVYYVTGAALYSILFSIETFWQSARRDNEPQSTLYEPRVKTVGQKLGYLRECIYFKWLTTKDDKQKRIIFGSVPSKFKLLYDLFDRIRYYFIKIFSSLEHHVRLKWSIIGAFTLESQSNDMYTEFCNLGHLITK